MKKYLIILLVLPFLTACENTWDSDARDLFKQGCINAAKKKQAMSEAMAKTMCECRLEKAMKIHPNFADAMNNIQDIIQDTTMKDCDPK